MRNGPKVLILIGLIVVGLLVVTITNNKPGQQPPPKVSDYTEDHNGDGHTEKPLEQHKPTSPPKPSSTEWNSKVNAFLESVESYHPPLDPHKFKHGELTFIRYNYSDKNSVFLTQPHYEWVTKYEAHVLPVFEKHAFHQENCLVIDVGANDGIYTQLSAGAGCKVVAFEMQDGCVEWIAASVLLNNVKDSVRIIPLPAFSSETTIETQHEEGGCSGTYSLSPNSLNEKPKGKKVTFKTVVIDKIVPEDLEITLLKVDVEGGDVGVIGGALHLFKQRRVKHLVAEIYSMMWPKPKSDEGLKVYHTILEAGYVAKCLGKYWLGNYPTTETFDMPIFTYEQRAEFDKLVKATRTCVDWHFYIPE